MTNLIQGFATPEGTKRYAEQSAAYTGVGHFSEFIKTRIQLSSIGIGTFPGAASDEQDQLTGQIISTALANGINVIDTAAHYRYGRALAAVGLGVRTAIEQGIPREAMFLVSKGGFITFRGGKPPNLDAWIDEEIIAKGLSSRDDIVNSIHCLSPTYIRHQLELSRGLMGVETLDAFLVDQPEVHIPVIGKEQTNQKLLQVFIELERAVGGNEIRCYGISTFNGFRVETDHVLFESLTSLIGIAEKAAAEVAGKPSAPHHFRVIQLPFNQVMSEGFTRFNQATGQDNIASTLQAAYQLKLYVMGSHGMMKGRLAGQSIDSVEQLLIQLDNAAQRSIQFNRSTPGIGTSLCGVRSPSHLADLLAVSKLPPIQKERYVTLYQRV